MRSHCELDQLAEELTLRREVDEFGNIYYYNEKNECHRIYGPAIIRPRGIVEWYQNGKHHRLDGPAVIWNGSPMYWFIDGTEYTKDKFNAHPLVVQYRANTAL